MNNLLDFLNKFGLAVDESTHTIVLLAGYYFILSIFILFNVINIFIYLLSIYILSNEKLLSKIPVKSGIIHSIINYSKKIRIGYIIFEAILLLFLIFVMIIISYGIVYEYIKIIN